MSMKPIVVFLVAVICSAAGAVAQSGSPLTIDSLAERINRRQEVMDNIHKKDVLKDSLGNQVEDLYRLWDLYEEESRQFTQKLTALTEENKKYASMLSGDTSVFEGDSIDVSKMPVCLVPHFSKINRVKAVRSKIEQTEVTIDKARELFGAGDEDVKDMIAKKISSQVMEIEKELSSLLEGDLSDFTEAQRQYIKPGLTERYNNFITYFE